ncbi:MAG: type II secretion system F family protein [Anaerolineae bacterium]|nr:type II secretion system F family protein [Anaerolineae bacterium]
MELADLLQNFGALWNPVVFASLVSLAALLVWLAFAPAAPRRDVRDRMDDYLDRDIVIEEDLRQSFFKRAIWPPMRSVLRFLGRLMPNKGLEATKLQLLQAGSPARMSALDFYGVRVLILLLAVALGFAIGNRQGGMTFGLRGALLAGAFGFIIPVYWLRGRVRSRKNRILRALPDALDMLTIGVEAGLAFESAMVRVGEKWDNALTREFRRAVAEMRVGTTREDALRRMAERCGVDELSSFIAVLVQSSQLGVSIAQVLQTQAEEMRVKRRQRAEELARQAGLKMIFPLALFILPALFLVILGPMVPRFLNLFATLTGGE